MYWLLYVWLTYDRQQAKSCPTRRHLWSFALQLCYPLQIAELSLESPITDQNSGHTMFDLILSMAGLKTSPKWRTRVHRMCKKWWQLLFEPTWRPVQALAVRMCPRVTFQKGTKDKPSSSKLVTAGRQLTTGQNCRLELCEQRKQTTSSAATIATKSLEEENSQNWSNKCQPSQPVSALSQLCQCSQSLVQAFAIAWTRGGALTCETNGTDCLWNSDPSVRDSELSLCRLCTDLCDSCERSDCQKFSISYQ